MSTGLNTVFTSFMHILITVHATWFGSTKLQLICFNRSRDKHENMYLQALIIQSTFCFRSVYLSGYETWAEKGRKG